MSITIDFNPEDLDLGEIVDFEEISGMPVGAIRRDNVSARSLLAMVFISERRRNPEFTLDDARRIRIEDLDTSAFLGNAPAAPLAPLVQPGGGRKRGKSS